MKGGTIFNSASDFRDAHHDPRGWVFTNGCFDILHIGHVRYLAAARALGDHLVVGLNTDAGIRRLKGNSRPLNAQGDRAEMLIALRSVDAVVLFDEDTPEGCLRVIQPRLLVKGGDYRKEQVAGGAYVESLGGSVVILPFVEGYSTSSLIGRIQKQEDRSQ